MTFFTFPTGNSLGKIPAKPDATTSSPFWILLFNEINFNLSSSFPCPVKIPLSLVFFRGPYDSLFLAFLGLTYDYLSFSLLGSYALVFFLSHYIPYFFVLEKENFWQYILTGFIVFCGMHFLWILINYIFIGKNYFLIFFTSSLWVEIIPTTILVMFLFPIIRKLENRIFS